MNRLLTEDVLEEVYGEMVRQFAMRGEQNHQPLYFLGIVTEEVGEVAKAAIEYENDQYRLELIHVAACAVQAIMAYDRGNHG